MKLQGRPRGAVATAAVRLPKEGWQHLEGAVRDSRMRGTRYLTMNERSFIFQTYAATPGRNFQSRSSFPNP